MFKVPGESTERGPGGAAPLGEREIGTPALPEEAAATLLRRRLRWLRRRVVQRFGDHQAATLGGWDEVPIARICKCGRVAWRDHVEVHGIVSDDGLSAFPVGVVACGSVWSCAVCSATVRTRRSLEVELAALAHSNAGGQLVMLTLTLRHEQGDDLAQLLDVLKASWKACQNNRQWSRGVRPALVGSITATEITRGPNGWHPHLHLLLFLPAGSTAAAELAGWLPLTWRATVAARLGSSAPDLVHGVHVQALDASAAGYVSKIADETTRADLKSDARSIWSVLDAIDDGEAWAVACFSEWFRATKGKRAIVWSRGLKDHFGIADVSDEDIAQQDVDGLVLDTVPSERWLAWCRTLTPAGVVQALAHLEQLESHHAGD